jgi:hypothetical protein
MMIGYGGRELSDRRGERVLVDLFADRVVGCGAHRSARRRRVQVMRLDRAVLLRRSADLGGS